MDKSLASSSHSSAMPPPPVSANLTDEKLSQKKPRHRHSPTQLAALNELYDKTEHPSLDERTSLAEQLGMQTKTVNAWFQNKRASSKKRNRGGASYELPPISTLLGSSSSSTANTPRHAELDDFLEDDYPLDNHLPRPSSLVVSLENSQSQQPFFAGNPEHKHFFAESETMPRRMRMRPSVEQTDELRKLYNRNPHPTKEQREELGDRIGMRYQSITNWFQNQRSLAKKRKEDEAEAEAAAAAKLPASPHEPRTYSAFPPASRHPSLALLPPPTSHPSLGPSVAPRARRSPSVSARSSAVAPNSVPPSPRRSTPRRSATPYSSGAGSLSRPRRTRPEPYQLDALKKLFTRTSNPSIEERTALALEVGMDIGKVTNWFRNLRQTARKRAKKMGIDDDGDHDDDSVGGYHLHDSAPVSRAGTPSFHSSSSSSDDHMDLDGDEYGADGAHSDMGSEDDYQEAVTPSPEPSPSPPPPAFSTASAKHSDGRDASMRVLGMVVDPAELEKGKAAASFSGVKIEDALLLLSFHKHVVQ